MPARPSSMTRPTRSRTSRENRLTCQTIFTFSHPPPMHYTFFIYALCALSGWAVGHIVGAVTHPPAWLLRD